jgi:hypothetical protein
MGVSPGVKKPVTSSSAPHTLRQTNACRCGRLVKIAQTSDVLFMVPCLAPTIAAGPVVALIEDEFESQDAVEKGASWEGRPPSVGGVKNFSAGVLSRSRLPSGVAPR